MKKFWETYRRKIMESCLGKNPSNLGTRTYWQNYLFALLMVYILPFCLIALLPVVTIPDLYNHPYVLTIDFTAVGVMVLLAFGSFIPITLRKAVFTITMFFFALSLLAIIDNPAPGLLYLLASCIFSILLYPHKYAFWWCHFNFFIFIFYAFLLHFGFHPLPASGGITTTLWVVIASNVVFLGYMVAALLPSVFRGIDRYIQAQLQLEQALREQQKALSGALAEVKSKNTELEEFAYVVSHDLQEPLRMVTSFLGLLEKKYKHQLDAKADNYIHYAVDGAQRMRLMINDLLHYSRAGRILGALQPINLTHMLKELQSLFASQYNDLCVQISWEDLPTIHSYPTPIQQVFQNLIGNAIKYRQPELPAVIHIAYSETETHHQFSVQDNGIGIDEAYFAKIFVVFHQLHGKQGAEGNGIGLSLCKKIVSQLNGQIWLTSEIGKGSTFYFTIPKTYQDESNSNTIG